MPPTAAFPIWGEWRWKSTLFFPPYRHFERMREIFFVRGQAKWEDNGKREAPCSLRLAITVFPAN